jgi:Ca2+-binding EF-hand superfamily protein
MRAKLSILLGIAVVLIGAIPGQSQYPGGGQDGGGFGGRGGKGGRGRNFDPAMIQQWMEKMKGQTGGDSAQAPQWTPGMGRGPGGMGRGGPGGGQGNSLDDFVQKQFQRYDKNGDGLLNSDEMPDNLKAELDKWDTDKNGFIDLNEFKAWMQARIQQRVLERNDENKDSTDSTEERKPPVAYRRGTLPKELPAWFSEMDTDQDAQIGLYEWKVSGRSLDEFTKIDRNGDGFLTVDEVLRYEVSQGRGPQTAPGGLADGGSYSFDNGTAPAMGLAPGAGFGGNNWGNAGGGRPTMFTPGGNNGDRGGRRGGWGGQGGGQGFGGQGKGDRANRKNRGGQGNG